MRIDEVQLQIEVKPNYDAQQLNKFKEDLSQANDRLKELEDSRKAIERAKPKKGDAAAWAEYEKRLESVNQDIKAQREVVEKASKAVDQQKQKMGLNALTLRELQNELKRYNTILNNLQPGTEQFNETKQHISDLKGRIAELRKTTNVMIEDTRGSLMKFSENWNHIGFAITNAFNVAEKISGVVGRVRSLLDPMGEVAREAEGVELAFDRLDKPGMLDKLREATHGTVSDLELMKQAVKFKDFNLPVEQLGTYLAFAQQKAKDTGEDIDYLVTSIVNGLGRQSKPILDNLGISALEIGEGVKRTGNFVQAVTDIVKERMGEVGDYVETSSERAAQASVRLQNAQKELGKEWLPVMEQLDNAYTEFQIGLMSVVRWMLQHRDGIFSVASALAKLAAVYAVYVGWREREVIVSKLSYAWNLKNVAAQKLNTAATIASSVALKAWQTTVLLANAASTLFTRGLGAMRVQMALARMEGMALTASGFGAILAVVSVLGVAIYSLTKSLRSNTDETNRATNAQRRLADAEREAEKSAAAETAKVKSLYGATQDVTKSEEERLAAVKKLKSEYPTYFGYLSNEAILAGKAAAQYQQLTSDILAAAKARAYQKKIDKLAEENADLDDQIEAGEKWLKEHNSEFSRAWEKRQGIAAGDGLLAKLVARGSGGYTVRRYQEKQDEVGDLRRLRNANESEIQKLSDKVLANQPATDRLSANSTFAGSTTPTGDGPKNGSGSGKDDPYQVDLAALEKNRREALNILKQSLVDGKVTEAEFQAEQQAEQMAYLQAKIALEKQYGKDSSETEGQMLDAVISEANAKHQQLLAEERENEQARLQQRREMLQQMEQAEKDALTGGNYAEALFQAEMMYSLDLINFEEYQRKKAAIEEAALKASLDREMKSAVKSGDFEGQLSVLEQQLSAKLITQEQYEDELTRITEEQEQRRHAIRDEFAQQAQALMSATSSLFSALQSREESRVDAKYKKLIAQAKKQGKDTSKLEEQQEAEKLEIKKKYADKQFALTVLQIISQTALGIQKIWAEWGWNPPVAAGLTATEVAVGAVQLATAKAQRDQAAGLYTGGYSEEYVEGYTADGDPKEVAGAIPVHKREFVVNHEALKLPMIRRVTDVIDSMQKRRVYSMTDATAELQRAVAAPGLASGGYSSPRNEEGGSRSEAMGDGDAVGRLVPLMERNNALLDEMLESGITILELRRQIRRQEQLEKNASR